MPKPGRLKRGADPCEFVGASSVSQQYERLTRRKDRNSK